MLPTLPRSEARGGGVMSFAVKTGYIWLQSVRTVCTVVIMARFEFRCTDEELSRWRSMAVSAGVTVAELVRTKLDDRLVDARKTETRAKRPRKRVVRLPAGEEVEIG